MAWTAIEGLSRTSDEYNEAVEWIKNHCDCPRLIHQTHVKKILDIPPIKSGNGKELCHLYNVAQQHLCALKSMGFQPSGHFVTSILELKLDHRTVFKWQQHSSGSTDVPHYDDLLGFIKLCEQTSEHHGRGHQESPRWCTQKVWSQTNDNTHCTCSNNRLIIFMQDQLTPTLLM